MTPRRAALVALTLCATAFVALTAIVAGHPAPFAVDLAALAVAEDVQAPALTEAMRAFSTVGSTPGIVAVIGVVGASILVVRRDARPLTWLLAASLGAIPMYQSLKALLDRVRPPDGLVAASGAAFPSGHATQGVAFFGMLAVVALWTLRGPVRTIAAAGAVALGSASGVSRIYLEVHWLTDVVGGFLLGGAWLATLLLVRDAVARRAG